MPYDENDNWVDDPNPYYSPKSLGLTIVAEIEYSDRCYQYDTRVVWRHKETGKLYTARDSGGSWPTPFEEYKTLSSLSTFNAVELIDEAREEAKDADYEGDPITEFVEKVRELHEGVK